VEVYYIGLLLLIILWMILGKNRSTRYKNGWWCLSAWFILSIIEGLRSFDIGTDTSMYTYLFSIDGMNSFEPGFQLLGILVHLITDDPTYFLLFIALITNGLIVYSVYKISSQPFISIFSYITLYYYFQSFNAMRQYIAIGVILVAYSFLRKNKILIYLIATLIAIFFHNSAIVGLLLLPYHFFKISKKKPASLLKSLIVPFVLGAMVAIFFKIGLNLFIAIFPKYYVYLQMTEFAGISVVQQIVVNSTIFLAYLLFTDNKEYILPLGTAVALSFMISSVGLLIRFIWFFDIFSIFAIAEIWNTNLIETRSKIILRILILTSSLSFMTYYLAMNVMRVANYSSSILD